MANLHDKDRFRVISSHRQNPELTSFQWLATCLGGVIAASLGGVVCYTTADGYRQALLNSGFSPLNSNFLYYNEVQRHSLTVVSILSPMFGITMFLGMAVFGGLMLSFGSIRGEARADHMFRTVCGWLPCLGVLIFAIVTILRPPERILIDLDHSRITGGKLPSGTTLETATVASINSYFANKENMVGVYTKRGERIDLIAVRNTEEAAQVAAEIQKFINSHGANFD